MALETHSFKLELPRETTPAEAHQAGLNYVEHVLRLNHHADYRWTGSKPHPTLPLEVEPKLAGFVLADLLLGCHMGSAVSVSRE